MKLKNELEVERIFAYAVALEQSGRQKNTVFGFRDIVYILNADKTLLLRFKTSKSEFPEPIGFFASDYDSSEFQINKGIISFIQDNQEFVRKKHCNVPSQTFEEVNDLFLWFQKQSPTEVASITFSKPSLDLLNDNLSHIEFMGRDGRLTILQRDIYSGTLIELNRRKASGLGLELYEDNIEQDFGPLGMRTNDFMALFSFNDKIRIRFLDSDKHYFIIEGVHNEVTGVVAGCLYDSIGELNYL